MKDFILDLDRPRKLKFGFKAIRLIREKFGDREISDIMNMKVDEMSTIAWAGLIHEEPELTVERVEGLLDEKIGEDYTVMDIIGILVEAIAEQIGIEKKTISPIFSTPEKPSSGSEPAIGNSTT